MPKTAVDIAKIRALVWPQVGFDRLIEFLQHGPTALLECLTEIEELREKIRSLTIT